MTPICDHYFISDDIFAETHQRGVIMFTFVSPAAQEWASIHLRQDHGGQHLVPRSFHHQTLSLPTSMAERWLFMLPPHLRIHVADHVPDEPTPPPFRKEPPP